VFRAPPGVVAFHCHRPEGRFTSNAAWSDRRFESLCPHLARSLASGPCSAHLRDAELTAEEIDDVVFGGRGHPHAWFRRWSDADPEGALQSVQVPMRWCDWCRVQPCILTGESGTYAQRCGRLCLWASKRSAG